MVGTQGLEPRLPPPRGGALTLTRHPGVEKAGIEPARRRLQGASGALPVIPRERGARYRVIPGGSCPIFRRAELTAGRLYGPPSGVFPAMDMSNIKPVREAR